MLADKTTKRLQGISECSKNAHKVRRAFQLMTNYPDLWIGYSRRIMRDKIGWKLQLNVNNVTEGGGIQATAVNFDGQPYTFRIVDPRQFVLTSTFTF